MSRNVTPDICTKKAISTNQVAQVEEINGVRLEKVQFHIYSSRKSHSLIALHIAPWPLLLWESRPFFLFGYKVRAEQEPDWQYLSWSEEGLCTNIQGNFNLRKDG